MAEIREIPGGAEESICLLPFRRLTNFRIFSCVSLDLSSSTTPLKEDFFFVRPHSPPNLVASNCSFSFAGLLNSTFVSFANQLSKQLVQLQAVDLCPSQIKVDCHSSNTTVEGFDADDPYIESFWKILSSFDIFQKQKFLKFVTGSDRAPAFGLKEIRMSVQKNGVEPTERLPTAYTCFSVLLLPRYASCEKLQRLLLRAIDESEGFGLQ
ncbi:HECT-domain (ubiquitin-transferase) domain protein [Toxoplasma gondii VAND]|uniref:HECT-type E3 ubiquitin transferase n=1 Tax=Toxoplasma gondii VAND TaxID=933077 RepID=A0A086PT44_TOXGO|nr:HECT-domain (ubiquitin-transferase) domain protein [Toxoplasma gondii VAND]